MQVFLLLAAFAAVPWMLIPKPYILKKRHEARMAQACLLVSAHMIMLNVAISIYRSTAYML